MIDLSFLTDEEQEAILKVLQRDSDLKRVEEERVRHLPEKVKDESQVKNMSGQWFYEAKSKRHREKIHGADIIRASMRRKPLTTAELSHNKMGKKKNTWVNNVNKEVSIEDTETSPSFAALSADNSALTAPQEGTKKAAASPSKERKNPFNSNLLEDDAQREDPGRRTSCSPASPKKDFILPSIENQSEVNLTNSRVEEPERTSAELNELQRQEGKPPVPKARKNMHKTSDVSLKSDDSFPQAPRRINPGNGKGTPPRGILKRNSSSSSTDSEMLRLIQTADPPNKNGLPTSAVLEGIAEKRSPPGRQPEEFSQNSLERSKQVRFSSNVSRKERPPSLELREGKESGEFVLLDSDYVKIHDDHASGLDSGQNDQVSPIKPFAFHSGELDGHAEDQTTSKEGTADPSSYNARGSGLPSDSLLSQKNLPSEPSSKMAPKLTKEPSVDEVKPETGTRQLNPEPDFPQSSTGQQFPSANTEDLQAPSISSTDLEQGSEEEPNPVVEALKRSVNRQIPSKSLEDIPSATSNKGKVNTQKEDLMLSAEDDQKAKQPHDPHTTTTGISTAPSFPVNQFSNPEKVKGMSKSVPTFPQEEVSTSVVSVYSGDFGNVDVKGNIQFAIDYVYQLKELHVFIAQCKDLAVADVKKHRSDPYVKSYLLPEKYRLGKRKTSVKKKTLDPVYNEILRYKVDKALLTSQRLNISVWHHDTFGRNSFLGEVELDLGIWDWNDKQMIWYPLKPRAPLAALELENRGAMKLALQYVPQPVGGKKPPATGEVHIWVKECSNLPILRDNKINTFVKCTVLPDTSRKSRQRTRAVAKTTEPVFNHTMVYDGFKPEDLKEACIELTIWDHNKLVNHFLGGLRIGLGTGTAHCVEGPQGCCTRVSPLRRIRKE